MAFFEFSFFLSFFLISFILFSFPFFFFCILFYPVVVNFVIVFFSFFFSLCCLGSHSCFILLSIFILFNRILCPVIPVLLFLMVVSYFFVLFLYILLPLLCLCFGYFFPYLSLFSLRLISVIGCCIFSSRTFLLCCYLFLLSYYSFSFFLPVICMFHLKFFNTRNGGKGGTASSFQISSQWLERRITYHNFTISLTCRPSAILDC